MGATLVPTALLSASLMAQLVPASVTLTSGESSATLPALRARVETAVSATSSDTNAQRARFERAAPDAARRSIPVPAKLGLAFAPLAPIAFTRVSASGTIYGFDTLLWRQRPH
jgi:hypothetical protein